MLGLIQSFINKQDITLCNHDILALNVYRIMVMRLVMERVEGVQQTLYQLLFVQYLLFLLIDQYCSPYYDAGQTAVDRVSAA